MQGGFGGMRTGAWLITAALCLTTLLARADTGMAAGQCMENWYHYEQGIRQLQAKNYDQARRDFTYYLNLPEMHYCMIGVAYFGRGLLFLAVGNNAKALEEFRLAVQNDVHPIEKISGKAYVNMGAIYYKWGEYQEAAKAYSRAVEISPGDGSAHYFLGMSYLKAGEMEKAEQEAAEAKSSVFRLPALKRTSQPSERRAANRQTHRHRVQRAANNPLTYFNAVPVNPPVFQI